MSATVPELPAYGVTLDSHTHPADVLSAHPRLADDEVADLQRTKLALTSAIDEAGDQPTRSVTRLAHLNAERHAPARILSELLGEDGFGFDSASTLRRNRANARGYTLDRDDPVVVLKDGTRTTVSKWLATNDTETKRPVGRPRASVAPSEEAA